MRTILVRVFPQIVCVTLSSVFPVPYTPSDARRFSVDSWRYRQLPTASR